MRVVIVGPRLAFMPKSAPAAMAGRGLVFNLDFRGICLTVPKFSVAMYIVFPRFGLTNSWMVWHGCHQAARKWDPGPWALLPEAALGR
jgi:hypothetical protein